MTPRESQTTYVVLGMLKLGARTGYDIKRLVDVSTRFFWAASYGQIYPELKRLEDAGLVKGEDDSQGGRQRRAYALTPAGERTLEDWLTGSDDPVQEVRDEALLKLFFAGELEPAQAIAIVRAKREHHEGVLARLRNIEPAVREGGGCPYVVLRYGIGHHSWIVEWCKQVEADLARGAATTPSEV